MPRRQDAQTQMAAAIDEAYERGRADAFCLLAKKYREQAAAELDASLRAAWRSERRNCMLRAAALEAEAEEIEAMAARKEPCEPRDTE